MWWIGNAVMAFLLVPCLAYSMAKLVRPIRAIDGHLSVIVQDLQATVADLENIPDLAETVFLTAAGRPGAERYGMAIKAAL